MSTWYQDHKEELKARPYMGRPTWELCNMKKALSMLSVMNTTEENQRLADVSQELKIRRLSKVA